MHYIVFSRVRNASGGLSSEIFTMTSKSEAIAQFNVLAAEFFNINVKAGNLYFVGFKSDLPFIKDYFISAPEGSISNSEKINKVLLNINLASCLNTLTASGYKPTELIEVSECEECDCKDINVKQNAYKEYLCSSCWATYWKSRKSLAEYVIELANGTASLDSFSEADKTAIINAWTDNDVNNNFELPGTSNRALLLNCGAYTEAELDAIEAASGLWPEEESEEESEEE